mgnify:CR=1 FL=1|jgi:hypothetical protein
MDKDAPGILTARPEQYLLLGNPVKGLRRLAGQLRGLSPAGVVKSLGGKTIPLAFDAINYGTELTDPAEPSRQQRELNALLVGGGGAVASLLTGGLDAVPAYAQLATDINQEAGIVPKEELNVGRLLNVENYLRELSYLVGKGLGYDRDIPEDRAYLREEGAKLAEEIKKVYEKSQQPFTPRPYSGGY